MLTMDKRERDVVGALRTTIHGELIQTQQDIRVHEQQLESLQKHAKYLAEKARVLDKVLEATNPYKR